MKTVASIKFTFNDKEYILSIQLDQFELELDEKERDAIILIKMTKIIASHIMGKVTINYENVI